MIKVKDERGLVRDPSSKAILQIDPNALSEHRRKKRLVHSLHREASRVCDLEQQVQRQSEELTSLKNLVQQLLDSNK